MSYQHIGKNFLPPDVVPKVTGKAKFAEDFRVDGMVFARLYTSPMPHAKVTRIDTSNALALEGVLGVLTAEDVPEATPPNAAILTNEPCYVGEPILAVAALDEKTAEDALALIEIELAPLPFVVDPLDSLREGGPDGHTEGNVYKRGEDIQSLKWSAEEVDNFVRAQAPEAEAPTQWEYGDLDAGFEQADLVLSESFVTTGYAHMSMEPRTAMAYWQNGKCYVHGSAQSQSFVIPGLARLLGIEQKDVVFISENTGGGFGSKIVAYPTMALPAYFSKKLGRPVMLRITRQEEFHIGSARVGFQGWVKAGFDSKGSLLAVDLYIVQDIGPHAAGGDASSAGGAVSILYQPDALRLRAVPVFTNTTPRGAQRGPGQNQIVAIMEPLLDKAARQLNIDRLAIRKLNAPDSNARINADQGPITSAYMQDALQQGAQMFDWQNRQASARAHSSATRRVALGIGQGYHSAGANGFDGLVRITPDGVIHLHSGVGNLGTYSYASTVRSAAEVLKCQWDHCAIEHGRSSLHLPWSSYQAGSNTTFTHSRANYVAAMDALEKMKSIAALTFGGTSTDYDIAEERVFRTGRPSQSLSYAEIAAKAINLGGAYSGYEYPDDIHQVTQRAVEALAGSGLIGVAKDNLIKDGTAPGLAVAFVELELDLETGKYQILDYLGVAECGTVVHPQGLAAQMRGGQVWGQGMASLERHVFDPQNGLPANVGYYQCRPVTHLDAPLNINSSAVDKPDPQSPFGARGIGEPAMGCATAAILCALSDALGGHLFNRTPVTPDMILNHLSASGEAGLKSFNNSLRINTF